MRRILPYFLVGHPEFPAHMEHRKHWEFAQILLGLEQLGALGDDAMVLSVASGHEEPVFELTHNARWVFATDIYGSGPFTEWEADLTMLRDPDAFARRPYNRRRLVVQYMDALDLRFEDETFGAAYSLSSIEHFGSIEMASRALSEQHRVVKHGGVVAFTTEVIVNETAPLVQEDLLLSTPDQINSLCRTITGLKPVEPIEFSVGQRSLEHVVSLEQALDDARVGFTDYPHILLEHEGRVFTSVSVFLIRDD